MVGSLLPVPKPPENHVAEPGAFETGPGPRHSAYRTIVEAAGSMQAAAVVALVE